MNTGDGKISGVHVMFAIACIMQGSVLLTSFVFGVTKQDTWIIVIIGYLASLLISLVYVALVKRFPGKTLVEILRAVFGNIAGSILSVIYFLFYLSLVVLDSNDASNFVVGRLMPETPKVIILAVLLFAASWAVRKGVVNMLRLSAFFVFFVLSVLVIDIFFTLKEFNINHLFPMLTMSPMKYVQGTHIVTTIPFCETVVFLMIFPHMRNQGGIRKVVLGGLSIGAATMFAVVVRDILVLGNMAWIYSLPTYESLRLINVGNILTRMEVLFAFTVLVLLFFKIIIIFYATAQTVAQVFGFKSIQPLAFVLGAIITVFPLFLFDNSSENVETAASVDVFYHIIFQFVLPFITLMVAMIRFPQKGNNMMPGPQPKPEEKS